MGTAYGRPTELADAQVVASKAVDEIRDLIPEVTMVLIGGSVRRLKPIVSDVDLLIVVPDDGATLLDRLGFAPPSIDTENGWHVTPKTATKELDGVRVEAWWCPETSVGPMLQFVTGPGDLNVYLRRQAQKHGLKLSQYGLLEGDQRLDDATPVRDYEHALFAEASLLVLLEMPTMSPEQRENWREYR